MNLKNTIKKFKESENFFVMLIKDIFISLIILSVIMFAFQIVYGSWMPMVVVESGSMEPNIDIGDIIFIENIERTYVILNQEHTQFNKQGDVILFKPFGDKYMTPILHRAVEFVEVGEPMWQNGPPAPHSGYITQGDNPITNVQIDQKVNISYKQPIKEEWIIGIARHRIPYIGHIRLLLE